MAVKRKYPVGIQSFEKLRKDGYMYVDKTQLVYKMITEGVPYFLSRPRRFGKSLLISTLQAVFEGRRELFEAFTTEDGIEQPQLFIARSDWRWEKHPVIRFDFSKCAEYTIDGLKEQINSTLAQYEREYGLTPEINDRSIRFENIILAAHQQVGRRVVVLVDEYDTVMLHNLGDPAKEREVREGGQTSPSACPRAFMSLKSNMTRRRRRLLTRLTVRATPRNTVSTAVQSSRSASLSPARNVM